MDEVRSTFTTNCWDRLGLLGSEQLALAAIGTEADCSRLVASWFQLFQLSPMVGLERRFIRDVGPKLNNSVIADGLTECISNHPDI